MKNSPMKTVFLIITGLLISCSDSTITYTVGGSASGINGNITLQNNGKDDFIITNDVGFTFDTALEKGKSYNVTVFKHPAGQTCTVSHGKGTVIKKVTDVAVVCAPTSGLLTVNINHLNGTVVLQNNGGDDLTTSSNGTETFTTEVAVGSDYDVTVLNQPTNQTCQITSGSGTMTADGAEVSVACGKVIFISSSTYDGGFGTLTVQPTGDHQCDIDAGNPDSTKSYKVLMASIHRTACTTANCSGGVSEHLDWVLTPNTTYVRPDDTIIFTTDSAGVFDFGGGMFINSFAAGAQVELWTGISGDWTTSANNCLEWTSQNNGDSGDIGYSDATDIATINASTTACDSATLHLICVEQ